MKKTNFASKIVSVMLAVMLGISTPCYTALAESYEATEGSSESSQVSEENELSGDIEVDSETPSQAVVSEVSDDEIDSTTPSADVVPEESEVESSAEPEASASPEASVSPEASASPEASVSPEASASPEASVSPKASATPEASATPKATATPEPTAVPVEVDGFKEFFTKVEVGAAYVDGQIIPFSSNVKRSANVAVLLDYTIPKGQVVEANKEYPFTIKAPLLLKKDITVEIVAQSGKLSGETVGYVKFSDGSGTIEATISFTEEAVKCGYGGMYYHDVSGGFVFTAKINKDKIDDKNHNKIEIEVNENTKFETDEIDFELPEGESSIDLVKSASEADFSDDSVTWTLDATPTVTGFGDDNYVAGIKITDDISDKNIILAEDFTVTARIKGGEEVEGTLTLASDKKSFVWESAEGVKIPSGVTLELTYKTYYDPSDSTNFKPDSKTGKVTINNSATAVSSAPTWVKNEETRLPEIQYSNYSDGSPSASDKAKVEIAVATIDKTGKALSGKYIQWTVTAKNSMLRKNPIAWDYLPQYFELATEKEITLDVYDANGNLMYSKPLEKGTDYEVIPTGTTTGNDQIKFKLDETTTGKQIITYSVKVKSGVKKSDISSNITNHVELWGDGIGLIVSKDATVNPGSIYLTKNGTYNRYDHSIDWTARIQTLGENHGTFTIKDTLLQVVYYGKSFRSSMNVTHTYVNGSMNITYYKSKDGSTVAYMENGEITEAGYAVGLGVQITNDGKGFEIKLNIEEDNKSGDEIIVTYKSQFSENDQAIWGTNISDNYGRFKVNNDIAVESDYIEYAASVRSTVTCSTKMLTKSSGGYDYNTKKISWTLNVNENRQELGTSGEGALITDELPDANWTFDTDSVVLKKNGQVIELDDSAINVTEDGSGKETMTIRLPYAEADSTGSGFMFTVDFTTSLKNKDAIKTNSTFNVTNKATLEAPQVANVESSAKTAVGTNILQKKGKLNEDGSRTIDWTIDVNKNLSDLSEYDTIYDKLQNGLNYKSVKIYSLSYVNNKLTQGEEFTDYTVKVENGEVAIKFNGENPFKERAYRIVLTTFVMENGTYKNTVDYRIASDPTKWSTEDEDEHEASYQAGWTNLPDGYGHLTITKYNKITLETLEGATYLIDGSAHEDNSPEAKSVYAEITTGSEGIAEIILPEGKYTVTEIKAPNGYIIGNNSSKTVTISTREDSQLSYYNTRAESGKAAITLYKYVTDVNDCGIELPKSDFENNISFQILKIDPNSSDSSESSEDSEVSEDEDGDDEYDEDYYGESEESSDTSEDSSSESKVNSGEELVATVNLSDFTVMKSETGLICWAYSKEVEPGEYKVIEMLGDDIVGWQYINTTNYINSDEQKNGTSSDKFVLNEKEEAEVTFINNYAKLFDVSISKQDANGAELEDALFQIEDNYGEIIDQWVSDGTPHKVSVTEGTYILKEMDAPAGYDEADDITFIVDGEGKVTVDGKSANPIVVVNELTKRDIQISKQDIGGNELAGAKLTLKDANNEVVASWTSDGSDHTVTVTMGTYTLHEESAPNGYNTAKDIVFSVDEEGEIHIGGYVVEKVVMIDEYTERDVVISKVDVNGNELEGAELTVTDEEGNEIDKWTSDGTNRTVTVPKFGTYTLTENTSPTGYDVANAITFVVDENGVVTVGGEEVTTVVMTDEYTKRDIVISKVDVNGNELEGAELTVTDEDGNEIDKWTSGTETHTVTVPKFGTYTLTENSAPAGYNLANSITFEVANDGKVTVNGEEVTAIVMTDEYTEREVVISKQDVNGNELEGAELTVTDEEGNEIDKWTSGTETHKVTVPKFGTYTLTENSAPAGYDVANAITFVVDENGVVTVDGKKVTAIVMVDETHEWDVEISKVDSDSGKEIAGAKLEIKNADGKVVASWTSGSDGKNSDGSLKTHTVKLPFGTYTLTEKSAPKGYEVAETITFTVGKDGKVKGGKVVMKDVKTPEVTPTPTPTAKPTVTPTATPNSSSPKTGDESNINMWIAIFAASACALTGSLVYRKKKQK